MPTYITVTKVPSKYLASTSNLLNVIQEQVHITNAMGLLKKRRKYGVRSPILSCGSPQISLKHLQLFDRSKIFFLEE